MGGTEVLPLFPWEERSMIRRICAPPTSPANGSTSSSSSSGSVAGQPPPPMPSKCCIGSSSQGGVVSFQPHVCNLGSEPYKQAEQHALRYLQKHPIGSSTSSTENAATSCDVCRIVEVLARNNWTMTFQGDSTMHQLADAFDCALRRRGYRVETNERRWRRPEGLFWRYGIGTVTRMKVWPLEPDETPSPVIIRYYSMYRPSFGDNSSEIFHVVERSDVLIMDHGLHYTFDQNNVFFSEMKELLETLYQKEGNTSTLDNRELARTALKRPKLIAWKETVSQHFDTTTGDYATRYRKAPEGCVEHPYLRNDSSFAPDHSTWYQEYMMQIAEELNLGVVNAGNASAFSGKPMSFDSSLVVLPFTQYTRPLHHLHPGGKDCTHICYTPFVWLPIWRSLRIALENVALDHHHKTRGHAGAIYVISDLRSVLGKLNTFLAGLFLCGALLLLKLCCEKSRNNERHVGGRILLMIGFIAAIGILSLAVDINGLSFE